MKYLADFARERGEEPNTVATYIRRHAEEFEGLTYMEGKKLVLTARALEILEKVYPMPQPVQVIQDFETMKALAEERAKVNKLEEELRKNAEVVAKANAVMHLIGVKDDEIDTLKSDLKDEKQLHAAANQKIESQHEKIENQQQTINDLKIKLVTEQNRKLSWRERLTGRKENNHLLEQPTTDACDAAVTTETEE